MNVFGIIVVVFAQASASDVGSLMQTGVKGHATSGFAFAIDNIQNQVLTLPLPKGDQLAINALLTSVTEDLDPSTDAGTPGKELSDLLDQITNLFAQIRTAQIAQIDGYVATYQIWSDNHSSCSTEMQQAEAAASSAFNTALTNHYDCRHEEAINYTSQKQSCQDAYNEIESLKVVLGETTLHTGGSSSGGTVTCVVPSPDTTSLFVWSGSEPSYKSWMADVKDSFDVTSQALDTFVSSWSTFETKCVNDHATWIAKRATCNSLQNTLTSDYCAWRTVRSLRCVAITDCETPYNDKRALADDPDEPVGVYTYYALTNKAILIIRVIDHLDCLIENLKQSIWDINACLLLPANDSQYATYDWLAKIDHITWDSDAVCEELPNRPADAVAYHTWVHDSLPNGWNTTHAGFSQNTTAC